MVVKTATAASAKVLPPSILKLTVAAVVAHATISSITATFLATSKATSIVSIALLVCISLLEVATLTAA